MDFSPDDRLLLVIPHPDDESLATGGLLQRSAKAGAAVRLLMMTDGDNNPWPQRWMEKRWRIGTEERKRWGAKRRREAEEALEKLGFTGETRCMQWPDQGITERLMREDGAAQQCFVEELEAWKPTRLVIPSCHDVHPDHNALNLLWQLALGKSRYTPEQVRAFLVHGRGEIPGREALMLSEEEQRRKYEAILCHTTQMVLSRKRFLAYARREESYHGIPVPQRVVEEHPVREAWVEEGVLRVRIKLPRWHGRSELWIAAETERGSKRWRISLRGEGRKTAQGWTEVEFPLQEPMQRLFVKLHHRPIFLDIAGWREVPI